MQSKPSNELFFIPALRVIIGTVFLVGWWYHVNGYSFYPSRGLWNWKYLLPSFLLTVSYRYYRGGREELRRELWHIADDLTKPPRVCLNLHNLSWRDSYEQLLSSMCTLFSYTYAYGPFCLLSGQCFVMPCISIYKVVTMYRGDSLTNAEVLFFIAVTFGCLFFQQSAIPFAMHRYFSHRSFATSRWFNLLMAAYGCMAKQRGPMWWASTHRRHHRHCETKLDPHCPGVQGWFYSHFGWLVNRDNFYIRLHLVRDWMNVWPEMLLFDLFFNHINFAIVNTLCVQLQPFLATYIWGSELPKGFVFHAANLASPISMHMVFFTNSVCHTWEEPSNLEEIYPGVHWSVVNGGNNTPVTTQVADKTQKVDEKLDTQHGIDEVSTSEGSSSEGEVVDVHGHAQASLKKPCIGLDNIFLGYWYGDGFHGRHHQNAKLAHHAPVWYKDYHFCLIVLLEKLRLVWNVQREQPKKESIDKQRSKDE